MEDLAVVYFVMEKDGRGKTKRKGIWQYHVDQKEISCAGRRVFFIKVYLPAFYYKKKMWTSETITAYMKELPIPLQGEKAYYLYHEEVKDFLHRTAEPLPLFWIRFLIQYYSITFDALVLLDDREMEIEELVAEYVPKSRYIGIATDNREAYETIKEELLEEYGFLLDVSTDYKGLHVPKKEKVLVVAGENIYGMTPAMVPGACNWISMATEGISGRRLCARTKDVRFLDMKCFLRENTNLDANF